MITHEDARLIISHRPDILPFYQANGWDISEGNWINIINDWWFMTDDVVKDQAGGDIQRYLAVLRGTPPPANGDGLIPGLPSIFGLDARIVLLGAGALVIAMLFFGD